MNNDHNPRRRPFANTVCLTMFLHLIAVVPTLFSQTTSPYGGWTAVTGQTTGYFHTEKIDDRYWLIDPSGASFLSRGVNAIRYRGDFSPPLGYNPYEQTTASKYGSAPVWAAAVVDRFHAWRFNTIGSWSDEELWGRLPYSVMLGIGAHSGADWLNRVFFDVFAPLFEEKAASLAAQTCGPLKNDPWLIGYYSDNELAWEVGADALQRVSALYLNFSAGAPGKTRLLDFLKGKYPTIADLNSAWETAYASYADLEQRTDFSEPASAAYIADNKEFLRLVSKRYFEVCRAAIKAADPNHLYLGCRFAWANEELQPVMEGAAGLLDVISINDYGTVIPTRTGLPYVSLYEQYAAIVQAPFLITEFSFRGADAPQPNTKGAGIPALPNQEQRTRKFLEYALAAVQSPSLVGYHWFAHCDQPVEGRSDGENSNYGLINLADRPWELLTNAMSQFQALTERIHQGQKPAVLLAWQRTHHADGKPVMPLANSEVLFQIPNGGGEWSVASLDPWITITSTKTSGTGTRVTIKYKLAANSDLQTRTGHIQINEAQFTVIQQGTNHSIFDNPATTTLTDDGWKWNGLGFFYDGYYPFLFLWGRQNWLYTIEAGLGETGFFLYDFQSASWGWTGTSLYPILWTWPDNTPIDLTTAAP